MSGSLIICGLPIGNLEDLSDRMKRTLADADIIAAEDTRNAGLVLNALGLKKNS